MFTGAAPISNNILEFLRATLCCSICSLYGQTESTASLVTNINDFSAGNVGGPTVC
jgi:long-subunit acyl-CoA synthetase (AMP-forming)